MFVFGVMSGWSRVSVRGLGLKRLHVALGLFDEGFRVAELAVAGAEKILRKEINASAHADMLVALKQDL